MHRLRIILAAAVIGIVLAPVLRELYRTVYCRIVAYGLARAVENIATEHHE